ncbi:hypothetical protein Pmani_036028 [Petrolisthes manimaculis]|uniref:Uncharacterized protein n=1 Tax=Petrolisthes manimaculis TaxID=1843537 RepID=A0AAE1NJD3_9EUCA|nr:hypothetical protein Pmani_036028 [Petrolisthes manimaculis]
MGLQAQLTQGPLASSAPDSSNTGREVSGGGNSNGGKGNVTRRFGTMNGSSMNGTNNRGSVSGASKVLSNLIRSGTGTINSKSITITLKSNAEVTANSDKMADTSKTTTVKKERDIRSGSVGGTSKILNNNMNISITKVPSTKTISTKIPIVNTSYTKIPNNNRKLNKPPPGLSRIPSLGGSEMTSGSHISGLSCSIVTKASRMPSLIKMTTSNNRFPQGTPRYSQSSNSRIFVNKEPVVTSHVSGTTTRLSMDISSTTGTMRNEMTTGESVSGGEGTLPSAVISGSRTNNTNKVTTNMDVSPYHTSNIPSPATIVHGVLNNCNRISPTSDDPLPIDMTSLSNRIPLDIMEELTGTTTRLSIPTSNELAALCSNDSALVSDESTALPSFSLCFQPTSSSPSSDLTEMGSKLAMQDVHEALFRQGYEMGSIVDSVRKNMLA